MSVTNQEDPQESLGRVFFRRFFFSAGSVCVVLASNPQLLVPTGQTAKIPWFNDEHRMLTQDDAQLGIIAFGLAMFALAAVLLPKKS